MTPDPRTVRVGAAPTIRVGAAASTAPRPQAARLAAIEPLGPVPDESLVCYWLKNPEIRASFRDMARVVAHWVLPEEYRRNRGCEFVSPTAYRAALDYLTGRAAT